MVCVKKLQARGYYHSEVNHKEEIVKSEGDHTNSMESIWLQFKVWVNSVHGIENPTLERNLLEFMFRYSICGVSRAECFEIFLEEIKLKVSK